MTETEMIFADPTLHVRFQTKVSVSGPDDCWEWKATRSAGRYGAIKVGGKYGRDLKAHRVQAAWAGIPIEGVVIRHTCNNTGCVNPAHLLPGTQYDNVQDMMRAGRNVASSGLSNGNSKISRHDVEQVFESLSSGHSGIATALNLGLSKSVVYGLAAGETYLEIARPEGLEPLTCRGERNGNAKLSASDVAQMRTRYREVKSFRQISKETGLSEKLVRRAVLGERWAGDVLGVAAVRPDEKAISRPGRRALTWEQVLEIRHELTVGTSRKELSAQFGVSKSLIDGIAQGRFYTTS